MIPRIDRNKYDIIAHCTFVFYDGIPTHNSESDMIQVAYCSTYLRYIYYFVYNYYKSWQSSICRLSNATVHIRYYHTNITKVFINKFYINFFILSSTIRMLTKVTNSLIPNLKYASILSLVSVHRESICNNTFLFIYQKVNFNLMAWPLKWMIKRCFSYMLYLLNRH